MRQALYATWAVAALLAAPATVHAQQSDQKAQAAKPAQASTATTKPATDATARQPMALIDREAARRTEPVTAEMIYKGWRAEALLDEDVFGPRGEQLGEIQEILVGPHGRITAIVVEGGGFLGIGDAAFRIPWSSVDLTPGQDGIRVALTEARAEALGLFDGPEWVATGPREWRVSELIGDYARLWNGFGFGYVTDAVFSREGKLLAVLVNRDVVYGAGLYGYPFYGWGYGWDPGLSYYALPYDSPATAVVVPVSRDRFDDEPFATGSTPKSTAK